MVERIDDLPQTIVRGERLDPQGLLFWSKLLGILAGASTTRAGTVKKIPAIADATGWADATAQADHNTLLQAMRDAGMMETS